MPKVNKKQFFPLLAILIPILLLRLPSLFEPYWYGDEGIYFAVAETLKRGGILYKDITDNKTPLIYYLFTLLKTQFWVRVVACIWVLLNTVLVYFLGKMLLGKKGATFSAFIFGLLASLPLLEGNIANGELFFILPTTIGFFLITKFFASNFQLPITNYQLLLPGSFFAIAFLFKVPALTDFGAAIIFLFLAQPSFKKFLQKALPLALGFSLTALPFVSYFALQGCFHQFLAASFLNNLPYTAAWGGEAFGAKALLFLKSLLLGFSLFLLFVFKDKFNPPTLLIYPWLLFSFFGATLSNRPYPHYLIQAVPAFSLLLGKLFSKNRKILDFFLALVVIFWALRLFNLSYLNLQYQRAYFKNFKDFISSRKSNRQYLAFFDPITPRNYKTAQFLKNNTQKEDKIFIWGDQALIYALSKRAATGRFVAAHHINDLKEAKQETIAALKKEQPKYILVDTGTEFPFPELFQMLREEYNKKAQFEALEVYQRINEI